MSDSQTSNINHFQEVAQKIYKLKITCKPTTKTKTTQDHENKIKQTKKTPSKHIYDDCFVYDESQFTGIIVL